MSVFFNEFLEIILVSQVQLPTQTNSHVILFRLLTWYGFQCLRLINKRFQYICDHLQSWYSKIPSRRNNSNRNIYSVGSFLHSVQQGAPLGFGWGPFLRHFSALHCSSVEMLVKRENPTHIHKCLKKSQSCDTECYSSVFSDWFSNQMHIVLSGNLKRFCDGAPLGLKYKAN